MGILVAILTFSRAAWVVLGVGITILLLQYLITALYLAEIKQFYIVPLTNFFVVGTLVVLLLSCNSVNIETKFRKELNLLEYRYSYALSDPTLSGRIHIWHSALEKIFESPLWGYGFIPFTDDRFMVKTGGYNTPHQQYLEIWYKSGLIGLIVFWLFFLQLLKIAILNLFSVDTYKRKISFFIYVAIIGISIGNFSQPNITYSITSNVLFASLAYYKIVFEKLRIVARVK